MTSEEKISFMNQTVKPIIDLLEKRLKNKTAALSAIQPNGLDSIPDEVKKMRELQAVRLNAVIEELTDLIDIAKAMYPNA